MGNNTSLEKAKNIVKILDSKKAKDIRLLNVHNNTVIADYFVLATGTSSTQVKSLADEISFQMRENYGVECTRSEGYSSASWIVLDYDSVIVHVFHSEARDYFKLEKLWADAEEIDINEIISEG